jgi:hypothetical protein
MPVIIDELSEPVEPEYIARLGGLPRLNGFPISEMELQWTAGGIIRLVNDLQCNNTILESAGRCTTEINKRRYPFWAIRSNSRLS